MLTDVFKRIFKNSNDLFLDKANKIVKKINNLEVEYEKLSNLECQKKISDFRELYQQGKVLLDDILPEVFALTREASKRTIGKRHFDVQMIGGITLHNGHIAEMKTGEGKTLVATLAATLNAISGLGVHIITVNDYLAYRDYNWMSPIYNFLGLTSGLITGSTDHDIRNQEYQKDIIYITNTEIGFDYLRDNMKFSKNEMCLASRGLNFAIVDEVDSILIDESRTPLIISGAGVHESSMYIEINKVIKKLSTKDYEIDEKTKSAQLTDSGNIVVEQLLKRAQLLDYDNELYSVQGYHLINYIIQSLKANFLFNKDIDYIIKNNEIMIIDEFTGRVMEGRRYSDGLHQAIEAKENVKIMHENQTLASITYQNFFRMYSKLSGMTGTAKTEANEFMHIYKLQVIEIPTYQKVIRKDADDLIYKNEQEKFNAIIEIIKQAHHIGQPILIGTTSIAKSEKISTLLKENNIKHNLLNAKHHEQEAHIIAEAGRFGAVTIATNMAGRGTDIMLGGNLEKRIETVLAQHPDINDSEKDALIKNITEEHGLERQKVVEAGGLFVLGSERHESRRIDNQLRGRSGRQGDPGKSQFLLSLYDDLLRIFNGEKIDMILSRVGFKGGESMNHSMLNRVIESSQKKVEAFHYEIRKNLLKYDNVTNEQRIFVYKQRLFFIEANNPRKIIENIISDVNSEIINSLQKDNLLDNDALIHKLHLAYLIPADALDNLRNQTIYLDEVNKFFYNIYHSKYFGTDINILYTLEKNILLASLDESWREHLYELDHIKEAIHLRAYAQKDPLAEYKIESFRLFENMLEKFRLSVIRKIFHIQMNH